MCTGGGTNGEEGGEEGGEEWDRRREIWKGRENDGEEDADGLRQTMNSGEGDKRRQ